MNSKISRRVLARTVAAKLLAEPSRRSHWVRATAAYLVEHGMDNDVDLVMNDIARELYEQGGHLVADVTSARELTDSVRDALASSLKEATSAQHVELAEHTDSDLLGGFIVRTPDAQMDTSVRTQLKQLASL